MRILGSTILDVRLGKKYKVLQVIDGSKCELHITALDGSDVDIARVKQLIQGDKCELQLMEVQ